MNGEDLERTLGRIEGKLGAIEDKLDAQGIRLDGYSKRLREVESWRDRLSGAKGVLLALWGSVVAVALAGIALLRDWVGGK